jgi:hypothetical protein
MLVIIVGSASIMAPAFGQAETETQIQTIPIQGQILVSSNCPNFEDVAYSGTIRTVGHVTRDPNGGFHAKSQIIFQNFKGIGQTTGDEYHLTANLGNAAFASEDGSPVAVTQEGTIHIRDGINEKAKVSAHLTINANGEITVVFDEVKVDCD